MNLLMTKLDDLTDWIINVDAEGKNAELKFTARLLVFIALMIVIGVVMGVLVCLTLVVLELLLGSLTGWVVGALVLLGFYRLARWAWA